MKIRTIIACAFSVLLPAVGLQAEQEAPEGKDGKLPRVFNYNRNAQLFRVDPQVSIPKEKERHMQKYEQIPEREAFNLKAAGTLPSAPPPQQQQRPEQDQRPKKDKNWLTPSDWNSPKDYAPDGADSLLPSPEEELEAIRKMFSSDESDPSNSEEEDSFLSYIQNRQKLEAQENAVNEGEKNYHDGSDLFSRETQNTLTFTPAVSFLSDLDREENGEESAAEVNAFKPALEMLNFSSEQETDVELEEGSISLKALAGLSSSESDTGRSPALKTQALLNDITSKWLNNEPSNAGLPTTGVQYNAPKALPGENLLHRNVTAQPLQMKSNQVSLPPTTPENRFNQIANTPGLRPSSQSSRSSFAPPGSTLRSPSDLGVLPSFDFKPRRVVGTKPKPTRSSFPKPPNSSTRTFQPARIGSGLNNSLPGMSGLSDPMGK